MKNILFLLTVILFVGYNSANAQHGFGTNTPDAQAVIDAQSNDMGILIPRVVLTAANNISPFASPPTTSMMVYNTATSGTAPNDVSPGYYYWDGAKWVRLVAGSDALSGTLSQGAAITAFSFDGTADATVTIADDGITSAMIANGAIQPEDMDISDGTNTWNFAGALQQGGDDVMTDDLTSGAIWYGNAPGVAIELAAGSNGDVLEISGGVPTWAAPGGGSEVIGNEVTNATDGSLTRSGAGTAVSPYTLAVNPAHNFNFTGNLQHNGSDVLTTEVDGIIGNEVTDAWNGTLARYGSGTTGDPYKLAVDTTYDFTFTGNVIFDSTVTFTGDLNLEGNIYMKDTLFITPDGAIVMDSTMIHFSYYAFEGNGPESLADLGNFTIIAIYGTNDVNITALPSNPSLGQMFIVMNSTDGKSITFPTGYGNGISTGNMMMWIYGPDPTGNSYDVRWYRVSNT